MSGNGPNIPRSEVRAGLNKYWANVEQRALEKGISKNAAERELENEFMAANAARKRIAIQARNNAARARAKVGGRRSRHRTRRTRRRHTRR